MMTPEHLKFLRQSAKELPHLPGVYRMINRSGKVLYVGKAKDLQSRVSSYFQNRSNGPRIAKMVEQIEHIDTTITRNEVEALVLENNLIKSLHPKYNIVFRDDKSYPYIQLSNHPYPQLAFYRGSSINKNYYFGPYPSSQAVRHSIHLIQKIFQLRSCSDTTFNYRSRPCLLYQIKHCCAPCVHYVSQEEYQDRVKETVLFLKGKTNTLIDVLQEKMKTAASNLAFEAAAHYRDQITSIGQLKSEQYINSQQSINVDVLSCLKQDSLSCIQWMSIRQGQYMGDKSFIIDQSKAPENYLESFLSQHYLGQYKPDYIISDFAISPLIQQTLNLEKGKKIHFSQQVVGERKKWLSMTQHNAHIALLRALCSSQQQSMRLKRLQELLHLQMLNRIECFDISHTFGEATVASCVVYDDQGMQPAQYRRYNIKSTGIGDDYAAMREVLIRRYHNQNLPVPDLVLLDGGKGQITVARQVWHELALNIPLLGIAKGPERKVGKEELIRDDGDIFSLEEHDPAFHLLQSIRDEAHRFAITGHRKKRDKQKRRSELDDVPLIGAKRKKALLLRFGGIREIKAASIEDIAQVQGISHSLATKIYHHLHTE